MIRTGGTSGNTLGGRLAEAGFRVAILEAGGFYEIGDALAAVPASSVLEIDSTLRNWNPLSDWGFLTTKQEGAGGRKLHYPRGKCVWEARTFYSPGSLHCLIIIGRQSMHLCTKGMWTDLYRNMPWL